MGRKRSVASIDELWPPARILDLAMRAYKEPFILERDRLPHAALVCLLYLGGFRINEALILLRNQFRTKTSLQRREFMVVEGALIEKTGGLERNTAIYLKDPLSVPVSALIDSVEGDLEFVFDMTDRAALYMVGRVSGGVVWNHWFRAQRDSFLAQAFHKDERKQIFGWKERKFSKSQSGGWYKDAEDRYAFLNWMFYADRLAQLTDSYWESERLSQEARAWLDSLA